MKSIRHQYLNMHKTPLVSIIGVFIIFAWNASHVFAVPPGAGTILSQERQEVIQEEIWDMKTDPPEDKIEEAPELTENADDNTSELTESADDNATESENKKKKINNK
ncbi:MAG: hypothetical protein U9R43_12765 [Thermodesulfobacteriota bacterium]|nr:hypothetical protein [Thermodesulfobacteriota bacterium]